jgi:hypothetical protein
MAGSAGFFNKGYEILLNMGLANSGLGDTPPPDAFYFTLVESPSTGISEEVETLDELYEIPKLIDRDWQRFEWIRETSNRYAQGRVSNPAPGWWWARFRIIAWVWSGDETLEVTTCVMLDSDSDTANCIAWWDLGDLLPMRYEKGDPIYIPYLDMRWTL